jgi:hypothetical protein
MFWSVVTFSLLSAEFFWLSVLPDVQTAAMAVSRDARVAEVVKAAAAGHHRVRHHLLAHIAVELRQDPIVVVWDVRHRRRGRKIGVGRCPSEVEPWAAVGGAVLDEMLRHATLVAHVSGHRRRRAMLLHIATTSIGSERLPNIISRWAFSHAPL